MLRNSREDGYPEQLADAERTLVKERWGSAYSTAERAGSDVFEGRARVPDSAAVVGMGLSGGGVRSATFCLGIFQGMQRKNTLRHVDFLSTVSGGGYWGGCFGALFARSVLKRKPAARAKQHTAKDETIATESDQPAAEKDRYPGVWPEVDEHLQDRSQLVNFLANNGNYLAPNGGADRFLFGAVLLRNWLAVQLMLWGLAMVVWLGLELPGHLVKLGSDYLMACTACSTDGLRCAMIDAIHRVSAAEAILSPWLLLPPIVFCTLMLPLAWSYWTVGAPGFELALRSSRSANTDTVDRATWKDLRRGFSVLVLQALIATLACHFLTEQITREIGLWIIAFTFGAEIAARPAPFASGSGLRTFAGSAALLMSVGVHVVICLFLDRCQSPEGGTDAFILTFEWAAFAFLAARLVLSSAFETFALWQDRELASQSRSLDRDNYARHNLSLWFQAATAIMLLSLLVGVLHSAGRFIVNWLSVNDRTPVALLGLVWTALSAGAQRFVSLGGKDASGKGPRVSLAWAAYIAGLAALAVPVLGTAVVVQLVVYAGGCDPKTTLQRILFAAVGIGGLGIIIGFSRYFLNNSSHLPLYSARLTRTFLGALQRSQSSGGLRQSPTCTLPWDDIAPRDYWKREVIRDGGGPLHLINVTVNETVDGRTQIESKERKGMGMALGPAALSLGVKHHLIQPWTNKAVSIGREGYRVFNYVRFGASRREAMKTQFGFDSDDGEPRECRFGGDQLSIGTWLGISGAAFTTGTGWRTNLGLSLLAGLFNLRLGHWWDAGAKRPLTLSRFVGPLFWVQQYFLRELFARFPGTANTMWYLSDGGHFENTGGYELLRRKCGVIVIVDAEADGKFEFEGLAGLVRKARLDFGANIEFLSHSAGTADLLLRNYLKPEVLPVFGGLTQLARGRWSAQTDLPLPPTNGRKPLYRLEAPDEACLSLAHAALARIRYADDTRGWLICLKPTLTGSEPTDVRRYHVEHPSFPHESTADQFFGEAQFESYRCLGEHVARKVFASGIPLNDAALSELKLRTGESR